MGSWSPAVCIASRTMLLTGRSVWQAQAVHRALDTERAAGRLWPQLLAGVGYRTYMTGKWHLPVEAARTFDQTSHVRPGMPMDTPEGYSRPVDGQRDPWNPADPKFGGYWEGGKHWSEVTAEDTLAFLHDARGRTEPFFIYCAFNAPTIPGRRPKLIWTAIRLSGFPCPSMPWPNTPMRRPWAPGGRCATNGWLLSREPTGPSRPSGANTTPSSPTSTPRSAASCRRSKPMVKRTTPGSFSPPTTGWPSVSMA